MTNQISFDDFSAAARKARDLRASARESLKLLVEFGSGQDELSIALASLCAARALRCLEDARKVEEGDDINAERTARSDRRSPTQSKENKGLVFSRDAHLDSGSSGCVRERDK